MGRELRLLSIMRTSLYTLRSICIDCLLIVYGFPCSAADLYGEYSISGQSRTAGGSRGPMKHAAPGCGRPQRGSVSDPTRTRPGVAEKRWARSHRTYIRVRRHSRPISQNGGRGKSGVWVFEINLPQNSKTLFKLFIGLSSFQDICPMTVVVQYWAETNRGVKIANCNASLP